MSDHIGLPLKAFCQGKTQAQVASLLGVSQGAISQMINSDRDVRVQRQEDGGYRAIELVCIGRKRLAA